MKQQKFAEVTNRQLQAYNEDGWHVIQVIGMKYAYSHEGPCCYVLLEKEESEESEE